MPPVLSEIRQQLADVEHQVNQLDGAGVQIILPVMPEADPATPSHHDGGRMFFDLPRTEAEAVRQWEKQNGHQVPQGAKVMFLVIRTGAGAAVGLSTDGE